jgi:hypothetical protein
VGGRWLEGGSGAAKERKHPGTSGESAVILALPGLILLSYPARRQAVFLTAGPERGRITFGRRGIGIGVGCKDYYSPSWLQNRKWLWRKSSCKSIVSPVFKFKEDL